MRDKLIDAHISLRRQTSKKIKRDGFEKLMENKYLEFWGRKTDNYFKVIQKWGGVIAVPTFNDMFVIIGQYRSQLNKTIFEFPRGFVEKEDNFESAVYRELYEETSIKASIIRYLGQVHADSGILNDNIHVYQTIVDPKYYNQIVNQQGLQAEEDITSISIVTEKELLNLIASGKINDAMTITAYTMLKAKISNGNLR